MIDFMKGRAKLAKLGQWNVFNTMNQSLNNGNMDQAAMKERVNQIRQRKFEFLSKFEKLSRLGKESRELKKKYNINRMESSS